MRLSLGVHLAAVLCLSLCGWSFAQTAATSPAAPAPPAAGPPATSPPADPAPPPAASQPASVPVAGENLEAVKSYARGDYEGAARLLEPAFRAGRTGIQDRLILARAYLHLKRTGDANAVLKNVLDSDKENPEANGLFGQLLLDANQSQDALKYLQHSYRLRPDPVTASALGRCHYALGDLPKAKTYLTAALQEDIRDPSNSLLLGRIHLERGSGALAEKYLLMAREAGLDSPELHLLLGRAYLLQAKTVGPVLVKRLAGSPEVGEVVEGWVVLGKAPAGEADQYKVALRYCALYEGLQVLKGEAASADGLFMVASGWFAAGDYELAARFLKALIEKEPRSRRACELQAALLIATKDFAALQKALAAAKADKTFDPQAVADWLVRAAAVLRADGKRDEATALLKQAETEQPTSEMVLRSLAALYAAAGDNKQARQYTARIIELFPDATDIDELRNNLRVLQEKTGVKP